ncbi:MAG: UvrD-helicase domain-containing protein [Dissulfurimicrobium sp.]|uniref:UvrD-helicase domain-containing protein n=1 Tax=Dissulfurimicrobium sp. TaxID=2022436 RepID=UPI0040494B01
MLPSDTNLDFPHILRVNASAGSGKTYLLAMRFVQFLLSDRIPQNALKNLIAITFTKEATAEMKRRVLKLLKKAAFGDNETIIALSDLIALKKDNIRQKALNAVDEIISFYDKWQIKTIDSFLYRLVQAAPYELGLSQQEELDESPQPFYEAALDRLLVSAQHKQTLSNLLKDVVLHYLAFQNRVSWWPRDAILQELKDLYELEGVYGADFQEGHNECSTRALAEKLSRKAGEILKMAEGQGIKFRKDALKAINKLETGDILGGLSSKYLAQDNPEALLSKGVAYSCAFESAWGELRKLAGEYVVSRAREDALPYIRLLSFWKNELSWVKRRSRRLFFSDITRYVKKMHDEFIAPELAFRLGDNLFHYLIDEFQDTSLIQWQGLAPFIENALSQGGTLFCVGDVKQILYRWRGSDRDVFEQAPKDLAKVVSGGVLDFNLQYNWRSEKIILDFVSRVFDPENIMAWAAREHDGPNVLTAEDVSFFSGAAQRLPPDYEHERNGGFVRIEHLEETSGADDTLDKTKIWLVNLLKEDVLRRFQHQDVFVLVRDNSQVSALTQAISQAGIPVLSNRQMDIRQDSIVQEIIQLLRFFDNPMDNCALSAVLTGQIFEVEWKKSTDLSPWEFLEDIGPARITPLYRQVMEALPAFWNATLKEFIFLTAYLTPYELAASIIKRFEMWTRFALHQSAMKHLLEILHKKSLDTELSAILSWIEQGPDEPFILKEDGEADAIRVMTVHKAKGLQSKVVIMPFAGLALKRHETRVIDLDGDRLTALNISGRLKDVSSKLKNIYRSEEARAWLDELNVFYVAVTRAREELHMLVSPKIGSSRNRLSNLLAAAFPDKEGAVICLGYPKTDQQETSTTDEDSTKEEMTDISWQSGDDASGQYHIVPPHVRAWPFLLKKKPLALLTNARRNASRFGDTVHRLLSLIDRPLNIYCETDELEAYLREISEKNLAIYPELAIVQSSDIDLARIARTICSPLAKSLFWTKADADIFIEMDIADETGEISRVDRVVKMDSSILIGEFKTAGVRHEADIEQLKRYIRLFSEVYSDHAVKGLLIYLELGEVIEIMPTDR